MHRPAPLARPLQPLRLGLRGLRGGGRGIGIKIAGGLLGFFALLMLAALFTPIAHPRDLEVDGATGLSADRIRAALTEEASGQSTFRVSEDDLMAAVADYPEVAEVKIDAHPPFRLDLTVVMRPPVGRAQIGGRTFTVAGDGTVLERASEAAVPKVDPSVGSLVLRDGRLTGDGGALAVLAAAPDTLLDLVRTLRRGDAGLEVELQRGPRLIFGSADSADDKWAAATAVIADGAATRATYIDVRVPGRPAVGGLGGSKTAGATDAPPTLTASPDGTIETVTPGDSAAQTPADGAAANSATSGTSQTQATPTQTPTTGTAPATGDATSGPSNGSASGPSTSTDTAAPSDSIGAAPAGNTDAGGITP